MEEPKDTGKYGIQIYSFKDAFDPPGKKSQLSILRRYIITRGQELPVVRARGTSPCIELYNENNERVNTLVSKAQGTLSLLRGDHSYHCPGVSYVNNPQSRVIPQIRRLSVFETEELGFSEKQYQTDLKERQRLFRESPSCRVYPGEGLVFPNQTVLAVKII